MAVTTWSDFQQQLTRLLDGDDVSSTVITPATLQQIISLGERRVYREVKSRWNEVGFINVYTANNLAPLPNDFESPSILHFGASALQPVAEEFLLDQSTQGQTKFFCIAGNSFTFAGPVADGTILQGRYFCRLPDLSETSLPTNNLFLYEPDLFIFGCLSQAAPFFDEDARIPLWEGRYGALRDELNLAHSRAAYSAGRIAVRPSARISRTPNWNTSTSNITGTYADQYAVAYA